MKRSRHRPGQPGYYPGYHTLDLRGAWDEATRKTVMARVNQSTAPRFFSVEEAARMQAVLDRVLPQDDRDAAHKIPVLALIDDRLYSGRHEGYRYEDMPPDGDAHRLGLRAIDEIAQHLFRRMFITLDPLQQDAVLLTIHDARPPAAMNVWRQMPPDRYWRLLMDDAARAYYSHPYAWDEIGYGGPAYPRGYMRLEHGDAEPWEAEERRYDFQAPANSLSGAYTPNGKWPRPEPA